MRTVRSSIKALSLAMIMAVAMLLSVMPTMKVNAAGQFTDLYQYVKTQSYVGDGSNIYYCDYNRYPFMDTTIWRIDKPKDSSIYDKIGYYIADFDSDGDDELLTFSFNTDFIPVISISELVDGTIVQSDFKVLDSAINVDGYSCNYSIDTLPKGYLNCFVYPMKGGLYIGVEGKASPAFLAGETVRKPNMT